jgi:hypothetical protein
MVRAFPVFLIALITLGLVAVPAAAQAPKPEETKASVPALDAMHEVIMPLWHEAWPNKDVKAMAAMVPDIERHMAAISKTVLPGILREKQKAWTAGVADLQAAVTAYKAAAGGGNNDALLKAAESLHSKYEGLVRVVRPALKELDDFHSSLYVLYHYQLSPFDLAKVSASVEALRVKMDTLSKVVLPDRLKAKAEVFNGQRAQLARAVADLVALVPGKDEARIKGAIEAMHAQYEALEKVL